jgi:transposase
VPRQWKVIQTVREKFNCRACEKITQPPAPFHVIPRALAGGEPAGDDPLRQVR